MPGRFVERRLPGVWFHHFFPLILVTDMPTRTNASTPGTALFASSRSRQASVDTPFLSRSQLALLAANAKNLTWSTMVGTDDCVRVTRRPSAVVLESSAAVKSLINLSRSASILSLMGLSLAV